MSATFPYFLRALRILLTCGLLALGSPTSPLFAACNTVIPLMPGETWRDPGRDVGEIVCFDLQLDAAGIAAIDVATAATAMPVRLGGLESGSSAAVTRLRQSATHLIVAANAGSYRLWVEAEDPRQYLSPFRLRARFVVGGLKSETDSEIEVDPEPLTALPCQGGLKSETDSEIEVDPEPLTALPCHGGNKSETDSEIEVDPEPFATVPCQGGNKSETDSEIEVDPEPLTALPCHGGSKSETDSEIEVDPEPFVTIPCHGGNKSETDSEIEVDPEPFIVVPCQAGKSETDSEIEVDPEPLVVDPSAELYDLADAGKILGKRLNELCQQDGRDDHGDGFVCATPLTWDRESTGEIGNDWSDDSDVFRFRVSSLETVEIEARGALELVTVLYDRHGQRLDSGYGSRWVRSLAPGAYFVRLEGRDGNVGGYSLRVGSASR